MYMLMHLGILGFVCLIPEVRSYLIFVSAQLLLIFLNFLFYYYSTIFLMFNLEILLLVLTE